MTQFNRIYQLIVGQPGTGGLEITNLRVVFNIKKTDGTDPNAAEIQIYNLSEESRNRINENDLIFLSAGYEDGAGLEDLFIGNVKEVRHEIFSPDVITNIMAKDGEQSLFEVKNSFSFEAGASGRQVLTKVLSFFPLANDLNNLIFTDKEYANGFAFTGPIREALDKVVKYLGLEWSVQNNEIKIIQFDGSDSTRSVNLTPATGLLESPQRINASDRVSAGKAKETKEGWRLKSLLSPKIEPGGRVVVTSREIDENSIFKITNVNHTGDNHGQEWTSVTEVTL